ncbi:MAG: hypothetical protein ABF562_03245 [Gluconobacter japonicus]|uniref:hypothetical protein n=1 Tax=Gluconobacter japonicus TaxID=376620 RepID=UPI0039EC04DD
MIVRILKATVIFALGYLLGKSVEHAQWELQIQRTRALIKESTRRTNLGGRPRNSETPEEAVGYKGGQG